MITPHIPTTELVRARQRALATLPTSNSVNTTIEILDRIETLRALSEGIIHGVEQFTSLKVSQFHILQALEHDITHPRHIGRRIGMEAKAVALTLESLEIKGLVYISERIGDRIIEAGLTEAGYAALGQAEGVQIRAMDTLLHQATHQEVTQLLDLLDQAAVHARTIMNTISTSNFVVPHSNSVE